MQNTIITTTTTRQIAITKETTPNQWYNIALAMECVALTKLRSAPNGLCGLPPKEALYAVVAKQVTSLDALTGLSRENAQLIMQQMSVRTLRAELQRLGKDNTQVGRASVVSTVLTADLQKQLKRVAALYVRADTKAYSPDDVDFLLEACENLINEKFASLSIAEIECAFAHATEVDFCAYGALNVQLLSQVLQAYQTRRNKALNAVLDQTAKDSQNIAHLQTVAEKNDVAYTQALGELEKLRVKNTTHKCFHTCPHHYIKRFLADGIIEVTPEAKREIWGEAQQQLAYDLLNDAPPTTDKKALKAYLTANNIAPLPSLRIVRSDYFKANLSPAFDYSKPETQFKEFAATYYAKKLYFCNIQIFE
jgi:peptidoglycan hydrolase-like protein with peptidoglycan-binding domain